MYCPFTGAGLYAQTREKKVVYTDEMNDPANWNITTGCYKATLSKNAGSSNSYYWCRMPVANNCAGQDRHWGFTWVGFSKLVSAEFIQYQEAELSFDFFIGSGTSKDEFQFGLIFDLHDVYKGYRAGGDFYLLSFDGVLGASIQAGLVQRQYIPDKSEYKWIGLEKGARVPFVSGWNKAVIYRKNNFVKVEINGKTSLSFNYSLDSPMKFSHLYFEAGDYYFDNFSVSRFVTRQAPPPAPPEPVSETDEATLYGLFTGINTYDMAPLMGCANDARALHGCFTELGAASDNLTLLLDRQVTRKGILDALQRYQSIVDENDIFIFSFSGHGAIGSIICQGDEPLDYTELNAALNLIQAKCKVVFLDCCHAGSNAGKNLFSAKGQMLRQNYYQALLDAQPGKSFLLSCDQDQLSVDGNVNGLFTATILRGLIQEIEKVDLNRDRLVDMRELYTYVHKEISKGNPYQLPEGPVYTTPVLKGDSDRIPIFSY